MKLKRYISTLCALIVPASLLFMPAYADNLVSVTTKITASVPDTPTGTDKYTIIVPSTVTMEESKTKNGVEATIPVCIKGNLSSTQKVTVTTSVSDFTRTGSSPVKATLTTPESTDWSADDCTGNGTSRDYIVSATLTPGKWSSVITFNCDLITDKLPDDIIPIGGTYTQNGVDIVGDGTTTKFPDTVQANDSYKDTDYTYTFTRDWSDWQTVKGTWAVKVTDKTKTEYGEIRSTICNFPVTDMSFAFASCSKMTKAPTVPETITDMTQAFAWCSSLSGTLTCNANPTSYDNALQSTQITAIDGACSEATKAALLATK